MAKKHQVITIRLSPEFHSTLMDHCKLLGVTLQAWSLATIAETLEEEQANLPELTDAERRTFKTTWRRIAYGPQQKGE